MPKSLYFMLMLACTSVVASCGDKLDPGTPDTGEPSQPATDSNVPVVQDGNGTAMTPTTGDTNTTTPTTTTPTPTTPSTTPAPTTGKGLCGTQATTISYATHIAPLVTNYCASCHGSGGTSPVMTTMNNTKSAFADRGAKEAVDNRSMPQGRSLSTDQICLFDTWATTNYAP